MSLCLSVLELEIWHPVHPIHVGRNKRHIPVWCHLAGLQKKYHNGIMLHLSFSLSLNLFRSLTHKYPQTAEGISVGIHRPDVKPRLSCSAWIYDSTKQAWGEALFPVPCNRQRNGFTFQQKTIPCDLKVIPVSKL